MSAMPCAAAAKPDACQWAITEWVPPHGEHVQPVPVLVQRLPAGQTPTEHVPPPPHCTAGSTHPQNVALVARSLNAWHAPPPEHTPPHERSGDWSHGVTPGG